MSHFFKKLSVFTVCSISLVLLLSPVASAITMEVAENVLVNENLLDDAYIVAGNTNVEADIFGDLYVASGSVVVNGNIHEDLVVGGGKVTVTGDVLGDLRILGGQVAIYGNVGDDIVLAGGQVDIGKGSVVAGTVVVGAGVLTVDGQIQEDLRGGLGMLFLNGLVDGDVILTVEDTLNLSDQAKIGGDLKYSALLETQVPEGVVDGEVKFNKFERDSVLENVTYLFFIQKVFSFLSALVLALLFVLTAPKWLIKSAQLTRKNVLRSFGVGLLTMISAIIGGIILMVTVIGVPLALIIFAGLLVMMYLAKIIVSVWLAGYVLNYKKKLNRGKLFAGTAGALLVYYLIGMVPFIGWLVNLILFLIGVGTFVLMKIDYVKFLQSKKMV